MSANIDSKEYSITTILEVDRDTLLLKYSTLYFAHPESKSLKDWLLLFFIRIVLSIRNLQDKNENEANERIETLKKEIDNELEELKSTKLTEDESDIRYALIQLEELLKGETNIQNIVSGLDKLAHSLKDGKKILDGRRAVAEGLSASLLSEAAIASIAGFVTGNVPRGKTDPVRNFFRRYNAPKNAAGESCSNAAGGESCSNAAGAQGGGRRKMRKTKRHTHKKSTQRRRYRKTVHRRRHH